MSDISIEAIRDGVRAEIRTMTVAWRELDALFGTEDAVDILNLTAPMAFLVLYRALVNEVILSISRLTDPKTTRIKGGPVPNLVIWYLLDDPAVDQSPGLRDELTESFEILRAAAHAFREHRNRAIAHLDQATALNLSITPLPDLVGADFAVVVALFQDTYNLYSRRALGTYNEFGEMYPSRRGGAALLALLKESEPYRRTQSARRLGL